MSIATKLSGDWYNELGSKMTLTAADDGSLTGTYNSAVGDAEDFYVLAGRFDAAPPTGEGVSIGWAVTFRNDYRNAHSTTAWSGQFFYDGSERILTQWLLTSSTTPSDVWQSTNIGHDAFTRSPPSANALAEIVKVQALKAGSQDPKDILSQFFHFVRPALHPIFSDTGCNSFWIIQKY